jgi:uncharacterized protein YdgA (DUF945 family)
VEVLQNFAQGGIIVREEDTVKAVAEFKDGTLTLNGNQLSGIF